MVQFKTVAECFESLGLDVNKMPDVSTFPDDEQQHTLDSFILDMVIKAHVKANNPEWKADFTGNQKNWYNWFWVKVDQDNESGFGFTHSITRYGDTFTFVGARRCMPDEGMARWVSGQFAQQYLNAQVKL